MGNICNVIPLQEPNTDDKANAKAICVDLSGNPIIFEADGAIAQKLSLDLEPIQPLHGYDKPWVGGAGKNKLPITLASLKAINTVGYWSGNKYTLNNVEFTPMTDDGGNVICVKVNGQSSALTIFILCSGASPNDANVGYVLSGCPTDGSTTSYQIQLTDGATSSLNINDFGSGASYTGGRWSTNPNCTIVVRSGYNAQNLMFYPMIRLATESDATFAPYTNFCPISGRTETAIATTGKNVYSDGNASGTQYVSKELSNPITAGTYTLSAVVTSSDTDENKCLIMDYGNNVSLGLISRSTNNQRVSITFTTDKTINTLNFYASTNYAKSSGDTFSFTDIQIERGSIATDYVPYKTPNTASLSFGQIVYSCKVDSKTGKLTINKTLAVFDGSNDEGWQAGTSYSEGRIFSINRWSSANNAKNPNNPTSNMIVNGATGSQNNTMSIGNNLNVRMSFDSGTAFKTFLASNPLTICYELATPIELQITPSELELLEGYNYITADGNINISLVPENVIDYVMGQIISAMGTNESGRTTASRAYSAKEYFYKDGKMYKCLTSIASGATFTVGTNCAETTIFAELTALNA